MCRRGGTRRATVHRTVAFRLVRVPCPIKIERVIPDGITLFMVRIVGLEPTRRGHRNLNPTRLPIPSYPRILLRQCRNQGGLPVAVPDIFVGGKAPSSSVDRCHSLTSLFPPQAALGSFPNSIISAYSWGILSRGNSLVNEKRGLRGAYTRGIFVICTNLALIKSFRLDI